VFHSYTYRNTGYASILILTSMLDANPKSLSMPYDVAQLCDYIQAVSHKIPPGILAVTSASMVQL